MRDSNGNYCLDPFPEPELKTKNAIQWWYKHQINPIRKALGLSEFDFILEPIQELKAERDSLKATVKKLKKELHK